MAGGGSHWWNYKICLDYYKIVQNIYIENKNGLTRTDNIYARTEDDGAQSFIVISNDEELKEANKQVEAYYKEQDWEYDEDTYGFKPLFIYGDYYDDHGYAW